MVLKKPGSETSVLIFGGKNNMERSSRVVEFSLDRETVMGYSAMREGRSFHKGALIDSEIFLIGGGCESIETYHALTHATDTVREVSYL